jgi:hypothetical protein
MNNPPAFPQQFHGTSEPSLSGLTMRDYFAGQAMPSALKILMHDYSRDMDDWFWNYKVDNEMLAEAAYQIADAMLKAREA